jgi:hypothetical protein
VALVENPLLKSDISVSEIVDQTIAYAQQIVAEYLVTSASAGHIKLVQRSKIAYLHRDAPEIAVNAATFLNAVGQLNKAIAQNDLLQAASSSFVAGCYAKEIWTAAGNGVTYAEVLDQYSKLQDGRKKGGQATKKLSREDEERARELVHKCIGSGVSKSAACTRAAAEMKRLYGVDVSGRTIAKLLQS